MPKSLGETLAASIPSPHVTPPRSVPDDYARNGVNGNSSSSTRATAAASPPRRRLNSAEMAGYDKDSHPGKGGGITFAFQDDLPKLPIPELEDTLQRYLAALKPLQTPREHAETRHAVHEFLKHEGPELQEKLKKYAVGKSSYIEQFCKLVRARADPL